MFTRKDFFDSRKETRHKLAPIVEGPFKVSEADTKTMVVIRGDELERVSRDRVVKAPDPTDKGPLWDEREPSRDRITEKETLGLKDLPILTGMPTPVVHLCHTREPEIPAPESLVQEALYSDRIQRGEGTPKNHYWLIDRIVNHATGDGTDWPEGTLLWRVRWYDEGKSGDSWETTDTLPHGHIVRYCSKVGTGLPDDIPTAVVGLL